MRGTDIVLNFLLNRRTYGECTEVEIVCSKYLHSPLGLASGVGLVGRLGLLGRPLQYVLTTPVLLGPLASRSLKFGGVSSVSSALAYCT
jgi:hypothetical protein